jgi:predicted ATP-dependent endonuclease of OLD family
MRIFLRLIRKIFFEKHLTDEFNTEAIMYIKQLNIKNFRVFDEISLFLNKGVNIIIGENNSGKTAIIDALRICLGYGKPDTNIYIQESDLHLNPSDPNEYNTDIQFDLIFEIESEIEKHCFNDFISQDPENPEQQTQRQEAYSNNIEARTNYKIREIEYLRAIGRLE